MQGLIIGLTVPVIGTTLGAAAVYALKDHMPPRLNKLFMGFTSGVMIAAAVCSLMLPAMEMGGGDGLGAIAPALVGFAAGVALMLLLDRFTPHEHAADATSEGPRSTISRTWKLVLAIILHNIPEGMAIGVAFAAVMDGADAYISVAGALALSIGIAIQNVPEGAIVSLPLRAVGNSKTKSFVIGFLSGVVQPVAAILTIWLASVMVPLMPLLLAFAAGAMLYVVVEELIPASAQGEHSNIGPLGFAAGFMLMLVLDSVL